jgi:large subunit ribosomal protein L24
MSARIRKNDTVKVISGKDAGKEGRVVHVYPKIDKVMIEGVNRVTKHQRVRTSRRGAREGGITHEEAPIHMSNVMPICPSCGKPARVWSKIVEGKRVRACRRCDGEF